MTAASITPFVSVILPVYNAEHYVREAIESILQQSFADFELIVINDGSTDGSEAVIRSIGDPRIIYRSQENAGLATTLNRGIQMARGGLIARQDNDDISLPGRIEKQVAFLQAHPHVGLLGTAASIIDKTGKQTGRFHDHPAGNATLQFHLLFNNPFVHSSVMFRRSAVNMAGGYSTDPSCFEDHNLWSRMSRTTQVANLSDRLVLYREVMGGMSRSVSDYRARVRKQAIDNLMELDCLSKDDCEKLVDLIHGTHVADSDYFMWKKFLRRSLELVVDALAARIGSGAGIFRKEIRKATQTFQRHYYNQILQSSESPLHRKFWAFALRRFMYHRYPAMFERS